MDPITFLSVFLKFAMHIPIEQKMLERPSNKRLSRTEIIEIYRKDMNKNSNLNISKKIFNWKLILIYLIMIYQLLKLKYQKLLLEFPEKLLYK